MIVLMTGNIDRMQAQRRIERRVIFCQLHNACKTTRFCRWHNNALYAGGGGAGNACDRIINKRREIKMAVRVDKFHASDPSSQAASFPASGGVCNGRASGAFAAAAGGAIGSDRRAGSASLNHCPSVARK